MSRAVVIATALLLASGAFADETPARDPMRPFGRTATGAAAVASGPRFLLTAVLIAPTRRVAVLNGKPRLLGEAVDGAELVAIEPSAVRLREQGAEFVISLGSPHAGQPATVQGEAVP